MSGVAGSLASPSSPSPFSSPFSASCLMFSGAIDPSFPFPLVSLASASAGGSFFSAAAADPFPFPAAPASRENRGLTFVTRAGLRTHASCREIFKG